MFWIALEVMVAWVYSHVLEYYLHKYIHKPKSKAWFKEHFGIHHRCSKRNFMYDEKYTQPISIRNDKEIHALLFLGAVHFPVVFLFPWAYLVLIFSAFSYYSIHRRAHKDITWGRQHVPWHYDHHMYKDQHKNWGVRLPWVDHLLGTRIKWVGSEKEVRQYSNFRKKLRYIHEFRSRRDKCKKLRRISSLVRSKPAGRDQISR